MGHFRDLPSQSCRMVWNKTKPNIKKPGNLELLEHRKHKTKHQPVNRTELFLQLGGGPHYNWKMMLPFCVASTTSINTKYWTTRYADVTVNSRFTQCIIAKPPMPMNVYWMLQWDYSRQLTKDVKDYISIRTAETGRSSSSWTQHCVKHASEMHQQMLADAGTKWTTQQQMYSVTPTTRRTFVFPTESSNITEKCCKVQQQCGKEHSVRCSSTRTATLHPWPLFQDSPGKPVSER